MDDNRIKKIVICGNYGATNLGDEAILDGIIRILKSSHPDADLTVLSANPEGTRSLHKINSVHLFPSGFRTFFRGIFQGTIGRTINTIKNSDLFILGGGGLFTDEKFMAVIIWAIQARIARFYGVPVFCLGQSVGPLNTLAGRRITQSVYLKTVGSTVRDRQSLDLLSKLGINNSTELSDPAFMLSSNEPVDIKDESYVVISVRPWIRNNEVLSENLASFIVWLWREKGLKSLLVPLQIEKDNDLGCMNTILERAGYIVENNGESTADFVEIFEYTADTNRIIELMSEAKVVIGMRLHSLILATIAQCPFIGISYSDKVMNFGERVGMKDYILDLNMDMGEDGLSKLEEKYEKMIKDEEIESKLANALLTERSKARKHIEILEEILT